MATIGVLTFYKVANFGANLQALSTYCYLQKQGHFPILIYYVPQESHTKLEEKRKTDQQVEAHFLFVDKYIKGQTDICFTIADVNRAIEKNSIECVIIGSDAVLQHHPLLSRIHVGHRKPVYIAKMGAERMFPNLFWGEGFAEHIRLGLMSVSSQNSEYKLFSNLVKKQMQKALQRFSYISVRDIWTQKMLFTITGNEYPVTPDPVFAFNNNVGELIPSKDEIISKYQLPSKYVLVSLMGQTIQKDQLTKLADLFHDKGFACVSLPMPTGKDWSHSFSHTIPEPLSPLDWYALIKNSSGYIGSNMHPIIVCLHNAVPCYSIDNWGATDFWNRPRNNGSSKVEDILRTFALEAYHQFICDKLCNINPAEIVNKLLFFPKEKVSAKSKDMYLQYQIMMKTLLKSLNC